MNAREEQALATRLRAAVQFCKADNGFTMKTDLKMGAEQRTAMEHCLVKNYLLKFGMDYFGKRDLIYIDMQGADDVARHDTKEYIPRVIPPKEEAAAADEDDE